MEIHQKSDNRIIIELSKDDMTSFSLNFSQIDYETDKTKQLINTLLYEAEKKLGKSFKADNKMMIDVLPENDGGCIFLFTISTSKKTVKADTKDSYAVLMLETSSPNDLFSLAQQLKIHRESIALCNLYSLEDSRFFLIVKPYYLDNLKITSILSEYGTVEGVSPLTVSLLKERGKLLSEDAIESLTL